MTSYLALPCTEHELVEWKQPFPKAALQVNVKQKHLYCTQTENEEQGGTLGNKIK